MWSCGGGDFFVLCGALLRHPDASAGCRLTLKELFGWRLMQTDPNWGNFLYDERTDMVHLIDFGAAREYPKPFVDDYVRMVRACAEKDADEVLLRSSRLGFLTGEPACLSCGCLISSRLSLPFLRFLPLFNRF